MLAVPDAMPGSKKSNPSAFQPSYESKSDQIEEIQKPEKVQKSSTQPNIERGEVNSASDIAARLTGGYSGKLIFEKKMKIFEKKMKIFEKKMKIFEKKMKIFQKK